MGKYEEALAKARFEYEQNLCASESEKSLLEIIFPELAENEDERIRKELIKFVSDVKSFAEDGRESWAVRKEDIEMCKRFLAYLEKQKDVETEIEKAYKNADKIQYKKGFEDGVASVKQKEQKSAEDKDAIEPTPKQDYSGLTDFERAIHRGFLCAGVENVPVSIIKQTAEEALKRIPAEWSEEDESILRLIHEALSCAYSVKNMDAQTCSVIREWLNNRVKSLRPQPKQERQIKTGDKVSIHCRKDRKEHIITIYDGKVGEVINVFDAKRNPWGHIVVRLDNGCNTGFYEDELEVLDEPHWKPSSDATEYIRKDAVISTIKDYLANWVDAYKIERLVDKIGKL